MARSYFRGHEANRFDALNGLPLAGFWQRGLGLAIDLVAGTAGWVGLEMIGARLVALVCCAVVPYATNGVSLGKCVARTRVVSLVGARLGFWQCVERVLGYGVALIEGMGFLQYFWGDNRMCVQDRMAETVVLDLRKSALRVGGVDDEDARMELVGRR